MLLWLSCAGLAAACVLRLLPIWRYGDLSSDDAQFHYRYIDLIRSNQNRLPKYDTRVLGPNNCSYPAGYHWLLSFMSPEAVKRVDWYGGLLLDFLVAILIAAAIGVTSSLGAPTVVSLVTLQLIAPSLTFSFIGPRAFTLTPRIFAQNLYMAVVLCWVLSNSDAPFIDATILGTATLLLAIALLSSKFTLQHVVFTTPLLLLFGIWQPIMTSCAAIILAFVLSKGFFLRQVVGHFDHLHWYLKLNQHFVSSRSNWANLWAALRSGNVSSVIGEILVYNAVIVGITRHTVVFLSLVVGYFFAKTEPQNIALALTLVALFPWLLTSFAAFRILGEAERYLEYAWPSAWFLFWTTLPAAWSMPALLVFGTVFAAFYAVNLVLIARQKQRYPTEDRDKIISDIRDRGDVLVLPLDVREMPWLLSKTQARIVGPFLQYSLRDGGEEYFSWFFSRYPFISAENWLEICEKYQPDLVLMTNQSQSAARKGTPGGYNMHSFVAVATSGPYSLFKRCADGR